ncbi:hypothetical protein F53441_79 [Fusarium austroafricanum]|uniref:Copper-fist domain-containing protein n=1 Tax=Fusarium austroafricanum TaxID=2364996 RepID=A0A8H4P0L9_9HYPO|nr:hypothetical protein F53441_79 [Fusarium austroafricanum]
MVSPNGLVFPGPAMNQANEGTPPIDQWLDLPNTAAVPTTSAIQGDFFMAPAMEPENAPTFPVAPVQGALPMDSANTAAVTAAPAAPTTPAATGEGDKRRGLIIDGIKYACRKHQKGNRTCMCTEACERPWDVIRKTGRPSGAKNDPRLQANRSLKNADRKVKKVRKAHDKWEQSFNRSSVADLCWQELTAAVMDALEPIEKAKVDASKADMEAQASAAGLPDYHTQYPDIFRHSAAPSPPAGHPPAAAAAPLVHNPASATFMVTAPQPALSATPIVGASPTIQIAPQPVPQMVLDPQMDQGFQMDPDFQMGSYGGMDPVGQMENDRLPEWDLDAWFSIPEDGFQMESTGEAFGPSVDVGGDVQKPPAETPPQEHVSPSDQDGLFGGDALEPPSVPQESLYTAEEENKAPFPRELCPPELLGVYDWTYDVPPMEAGMDVDEVEFKQYFG